jgi:hypothetical protein
VLSQAICNFSCFRIKRPDVQLQVSAGPWHPSRGCLDAGRKGPAVKGHLEMPGGGRGMCPVVAIRSAR